jgi:hypothetical protein
MKPSGGLTTTSNAMVYSSIAFPHTQAEAQIATMENFSKKSVMLTFSSHDREHAAHHPPANRG